jgi:uncharacterized membrane protein
MKHKLFLSILSLLLFVGLAYGIAYVSTTVTAQNTYTDDILVPTGTTPDISIRPNGVMTIKLYRKFTESGATWGEVYSWDLTGASTDYEYIIDKPVPEDTYFKIGCPSGNFTSGSTYLRIGFK